MCIQYIYTIVQAFYFIWYFYLFKFNKAKNLWKPTESLFFFWHNFHRKEYNMQCNAILSCLRIFFAFHKAFIFLSFDSFIQILYCFCSELFIFCVVHGWSVYEGEGVVKWESQRKFDYINTLYETQTTDSQTRPNVAFFWFHLKCTK